LTVEDEPFLAVRSFVVTYGSGTTIEPHRHEWHQLLFARSGAMSVQAERQSWMIPPGKCVFVPAGSAHSIRMWGEVAMNSLAFAKALAWEDLASWDCRVISVTPLLRELVLRVAELGALDVRLEAHARLMGVLADEMSMAPVEPLTLPLPEDRRALRVARHVLRDSSGGETLEALARKYGAGKRTVERLFCAETGMSFGLWRQKARMLDAARMLAEGRPVTEAAMDVGYASTSAFIAAFKETFGCTPGRM
jgi:AraC-like DNA-binding protein